MMLPNEVRPERNAPEMDRRLPLADAPLDREVSKSSYNSGMKGRRCAKRSESNVDRTAAAAASAAAPPPVFENSGGRKPASFRTKNCRDIDALESRSTQRNKLHGEQPEAPSCRQHACCDAANDSLTCNCGESESSCIDLGTSHRMASCEHCASSSNDCLTEYKRGDVNVRWSRSSARNIVSGNRAWLVVTLLLVVLTSLCSGNSNQCALGLTTPGRTWPQGDIVLEYGQPLSILCMLNKTFVDTAFPGKNASDLVFFRNKKEIEPEYIRIVNDTTIEMYVEKPPPAEDMYYCKLRLSDEYSKQLEAVCLNKVVIGFKPQEPQNFSCVSHNWENMICSWDPVQNYVTTRFTLVFKLPGRAGGRKLYPCPKKEPLKPNTCLWDASTDPIYRQPYESYTFIMNVANVLGNISVQYKFHHFAHVIPAKPANLSVVNKTSDSALLHWSVPFPMQNFPSGLHHRVTYQHQWDHQRTWQVINITNEIHTSKRYYNLTGLEFANTVYDVRIFMKSAVAIGEDKWSNFSDVTFRTPARLPGQPPRTDIGSFEIAENNANRDVYLYWQAIPPYLENGDNFKYQIAHVEEDGRKLYLLPNETTRTYAKFKCISFNSFRFEVVTTNVVGANKERAKIFVPSRTDLPPEPLAFTKIAFDGGLYELSWKPPLNSANITNYTIFWCDNERDRPYQCTGYLDWVHVSRNTTIYNITMDPKKFYQFAISANTAVASSGMVWASCTVIHNKVVGKMKSVWINSIGSDFIQVGWKLDCSDRIGIVEGFKIYYCPIVSPYNLDCKKGSQLTTTIRADPHMIHGSVYGLKPYTTYSISVAVLTKSGEGNPSDPLYNTTLEAPPTTAPLDVQVTNVTNTTMFVSWKPPSAMNGVLRYYEVYYNTKSEKVEEANHLLLEGLASHRNYSISVAACTVSCSVRSSAILRMTDIGVPGKIGKIPNVKFMNSSQVQVKWSPPYNTGGFLEYYQIWSADGDIKNSTSTEANLPIPDCNTIGREKMYQFRVRAVNVAPDGTHLIGPWSEPGEGTCYSGGPSPFVMIIIWIISFLSALAFLFCVAYTSKRMWLKCKAMQDVEVKLPPGLAPNMKLLHKVGEQHIRQSSADSSGCSSGQESVTSSLTSDSHVSSDSGADVDPVHPPANKLLEAPPTWEASRLRQRNVGATRPGAISIDSTRWDPYAKVVKTGGEPSIEDALSLARSTPNLTDNSTGCCTASPQAWSSTGYISMPSSSEELSRNPSPMPKESVNPGGYSVVGLAPKSLRSKSDLSSDIPKSAMPYVSLASLERRSKHPKPLDSLDFDDLSFIEPNVGGAFKPVLDKSSSSKPYVQTGLLDSANKPFAAALSKEAANHEPKVPFATSSLSDSTRKPFASTFSSPMSFKQKLEADPTVSKPYVAVGSIPEITAKPSTRLDDPPPQQQQQQQQQKSPPIVETSTSKPYVTASSAFQMLKQREKPAAQQLGQSASEEESDKSLPPPYSMYWPTKYTSEAETGDKSIGSSKRSAPSYVTLGENPRHESQATSATSSPYVQHQRFEKQMPQPQPSAPAASDEQYSKVSVAPNLPQ